MGPIAKRLIASTYFNPEYRSGIPCLHCNADTHSAWGDIVYPHRKDLYTKLFWVCLNCEAFVGCHPGTQRPLGSPANAVLRKARSRVHELFDPLWKPGLYKTMTRNKAYAWLANKMSIPITVCHVGMFNMKQCVEAEEICAEFWAEKDSEEEE